MVTPIAFSTIILLQFRPIVTSGRPRPVFGAETESAWSTVSNLVDGEFRSDKPKRVVNVDFTFYADPILDHLY
jgi:hypothetical protein